MSDLTVLGVAMSERFIVFGAIGVVLIIISIMLLAGRGIFLLKGYSTMSTEKKAQYDTKAISKFYGKILLPMGILAPFIGIESITNWFLWTWLTVGAVFMVSAFIYANTGNRFRK